MVGMSLEVENLYDAARVTYARGDYERVVSMSPAIDRECAKVVLVARCAFALAGAGYGAMLALILTRVVKTPRTRVLAFVGSLVVTALVGSGIGFWAIAPVTRAEILIGTALLVGGALVGVGLTVFVRHVSSSRSLQVSRESVHD